jgi:hypothetical protein
MQTPAEQVAKCGLDIPAFLRIPQDARAAAWQAYRAKHPPIVHQVPPPRAAEVAYKAVQQAKKEERLAALHALPRKPKEPPLVIKGLEAGGLATAADIGKELNVPAKIVRRILRTQKFPKPAWGWSFNDVQADLVRALVRKHAPKT